MDEKVDINSLPPKYGKNGERVGSQKQTKEQGQAKADWHIIKQQLVTFGIWENVADILTKMSVRKEVNFPI